jgi:chromosomal replication initiator protein
LITGVDDILAAVSMFYHVDVFLILGPTRLAHIVRARQVAMYLMRQHTMLSLESIADAVGRSDHTTALHGFREIKRRRLEDPLLGAQIERIERVLKEVEARQFLMGLVSRSE